MHIPIKKSLLKKKKMVFAFFDVRIQRINNNFETSVYRKPTNILRNSKYSAPKVWKNVILKYLLNKIRTSRICNIYKYFITEIVKLREILATNVSTNRPTNLVN